jgi:hypothetical protein
MAARSRSSSFSSAAVSPSLLPSIPSPSSSTNEPHHSNENDVATAIRPRVQPRPRRQNQTTPYLWPEKINDYVLSARLGLRNQHVHYQRFYGSSSAVYVAHLSADQQSLAPLDAPLTQGPFALKIIYNFDLNATNRGVLAAQDIELDLFTHLSQHDNIVHIEHFFSDHLPTPLPLNWDADKQLIAQPTAYVVMELFHLSLADVIAYRRRKYPKHDFD